MQFVGLVLYLAALRAQRYIGHVKNQQPINSTQKHTVFNNYRVSEHTTFTTDLRTDIFVVV